MPTIIRGALVALVTIATVLVGSLPARAEESHEAPSSTDRPDPEAQPRSGVWAFGIEIRPNGVGPCTPATPAPCAHSVYSWNCPNPVEFRLVGVRTYMAAAGTRFVGFRLRSRLIPRNQAPGTTPWAEDVETFPGRPTATSRLMATRDESGRHLLSRRWDLQVEVRFDRVGAADVVRLERFPARIDCS